MEGGSRGQLRVILLPSYVGIYVVPVLGLVGPWFLANPAAVGKRQEPTCPLRTDYVNMNCRSSESESLETVTQSRPVLAWKNGAEMLQADVNAPDRFQCQIRAPTAPEQRPIDQRHCAPTLLHLNVSDAE